MPNKDNITKAAIRQAMLADVVTEDQAVDIVVDAFEAECIDGLPKRSDAVQACMSALRQVITLRNGMCATSQEKWRVPKKPPLYMLARLVVLYEIFKRISTADSKSIVVLRDGIAGSRRYGVYSMDVKDMRRALRRLYKSLSDAEVNQIVDMIHDDLSLSEVGHDPDAVPTKDGVFDYGTKKTEPWSEDSPVYLYKLPYSIPEGGLVEPVITRPDGTQWSFTSWLPSIQPDADTREAIWDVIGALLRPLVNWRVLILLDGEGRNGKGSLVAMFRALVGGEGNYATISIRDFAKKENLSQLMHVSANIVDENDGTYVPSSEIIKAMADHNPVTMRQLYKDPVTMRPNAVNIQCVNELPKFKDKSRGLLSRLYDIPFKSVFILGQNDDPAIKEDYLVRPEVVRWIAYHALVERPAYYMLRRTTVIEDALRDFRVETDPVAAFWADEARENVLGCFLPYGFMYAWYTRWLRETNPSGHSVDQRKFTRQIKELAAADGWIDTGGKRSCHAWMIGCEPQAAKYAKRRPNGCGSQTYDEADQLARWYTYTRPSNERGLVLSVVDDWCTVHGVKPREFVEGHAHSDPQQRYNLVTARTLGAFVSDVKAGTIDFHAASYECDHSWPHI